MTNPRRQLAVGSVCSFGYIQQCLPDLELKRAAAKPEWNGPVIAAAENPVEPKLSRVGVFSELCVGPLFLQGCQRRFSSVFFAEAQEINPTLSPGDQGLPKQSSAETKVEVHAFTMFPDLTGR